MKSLIVTIGLVSIVSCATPHIEQIDCRSAPELTDEELAAITCNGECQLPRDVLKKIFDRYQAKSECLEQYKGAVKPYQ